MRILFTIVHFFSPGAKGPRAYASMGRDAPARIAALKNCISAAHQLFGERQFTLNHGERAAFPANRALRHQVEVVVCTAGDHHLVPRLDLPAGSFRHHPTKADPALLGFECHAVLRDRLGDFDYYCYLEDDLLLIDPLFFTKLAWFNRATGDESLLQPNRYEISFQGNVHKVYIDGELPARNSVKFQNVGEQPELAAKLFDQKFLFQRRLNPHAGCFFLNAKQMDHFARQPYFLDRSVSFIGPPESAATLGIMRAFRVYKPARENAAFLEIEHPGTSYLSLVGHAVRLAETTAPARQRASAPPTPAAPDPLDAAVQEGLDNFRL